jgi:hypothetical protein
MRHTAISLWVAAGADPKQVATWADHASVATVLDRYGHLYSHRQESDMTALDKLEADAGTTTNVRRIR